MGWTTIASNNGLLLDQKRCNHEKIIKNINQMIQVSLESTLDYLPTMKNLIAKQDTLIALPKIANNRNSIY
jgi:hypothetical protein